LLTPAPGAPAACAVPAAPPIDLGSLTRWITEAAVRHPEDLPQYVATCLGITARRTDAVLRQLVALQWLATPDLGDQRRFVPGSLRQVVKRYALKGLQEDMPWRRDFAPCFDTPREITRMAQHAFTELLNNAIDHSGGSTVTVSMRQTPLQLQLLVSDDGCGLFDRIARSFEIGDPRLALLELCKGKLTSAPREHSGHGLFFTSQLSDVFDIRANAQAFQRRAWERLQWQVGRQSSQTGTSVYLAIQLDTKRTLEEVLRAHSLHQESVGFDRTTVPLHLIGSHQVLASRADAKRAVARLSQFRRVEIDFAGITDVGHGFADEMFRIFRREHPETELVPVGMNAQVAAMVHSIAA
jgi:anti-sigma regulatory factor (Ser/Thr protein kinase)